MALENYRVIQYPEKNTVDNTDYVLIDSSSNGTNKYQVTRILTEAAAAAQTKVDAEAAAREEADTELKADLEKQSGLTAEAKVALLACFANVAWINDQGQTYYNNLEAALYNDYPKIIATFSPGANVIYTDDDLDDLKQYLTVKYYTSKADTGATIPSANYTLSGVLNEGENTIRVVYNTDYKTTFIVNAIDFYNIWSRSLADGTLQKVAGGVDPNRSDTTNYPSRTSINFDLIRRSYPVSRGKAPYYVYNSTGEASIYYPVPVPNGANHVKISMAPSGQFIYAHTLVLDEATGQYGDSIFENRKTWTQLSTGVLEWDITPYDNMFLVVNSKYDSAGTSYPVEPQNMVIEFSEVS